MFAGPPCHTRTPCFSRLRSRFGCKANAGAIPSPAPAIPVPAAAQAAKHGRVGGPIGNQNKIVSKPKSKPKPKPEPRPEPKAITKPRSKCVQQKAPRRRCPACLARPHTDGSRHVVRYIACMTCQRCADDCACGSSCNCESCFVRRAKELQRSQLKAWNSKGTRSASCAIST